MRFIVIYFWDKNFNPAFSLRKGYHERWSLDSNSLGYVNKSLLVRLVFNELTQSGSKQHDVIYISFTILLRFI